MCSCYKFRQVGKNSNKKYDDDDNEEEEEEEEEAAETKEKEEEEEEIKENQYEKANNLIHWSENTSFLFF